MYKILIVDDEKMIRMGMKNAIDWMKIGIDEVFTAASGNEALEILKKEEPQIMVTSGAHQSGKGSCAGTASDRTYRI